MRQLVKNSHRFRRVADRGLSALVVGVDLLRFQHEIRHPDNANMYSGYLALQRRKTSLRAELKATLSMHRYLEHPSVMRIIEESDRVAHAIDALREDALAARPRRILREIVQSATTV